MCDTVDEQRANRCKELQKRDWMSVRGERITPAITALRMIPFPDTTTSAAADADAAAAADADADATARFGPLLPLAEIAHPHGLSLTRRHERHLPRRPRPSV
jgi:hypothetical protein